MNESNASITDIPVNSFSSDDVSLKIYLSQYLNVAEHFQILFIVSIIFLLPYYMFGMYFFIIVATDVSWHFLK